MAVSVRDHTHKKPLSSPPPLSKEMEQAVGALDAVCQQLLDDAFAGDRRDVERMYWQQRFKNIATPVTLALSECRGGPRHFHQHYRHSERDNAVLEPVLEDPLETLAQTCETALAACRRELLGIEDDRIVAKRNALERALGGFLGQYRA